MDRVCAEHSEGWMTLIKLTAKLTLFSVLKSISRVSVVSCLLLAHKTCVPEILLIALQWT